MTPTAKDVRVTIQFEEHEARFLAGLVVASMPRLTPEQIAAGRAIAGKFIEAGLARKAVLIEQHGEDVMEDFAKRLIGEHPFIEDVVL